ncbi:DUF1254 domain-containing protein, partial [Thiolapillus sp.]|uniref:DUF1254 domain-containing protein n=5 Tax=Thiolapillus sp. TaxID=2017437 RepID=UPI003AF61D32
MKQTLLTQLAGGTLILVAGLGLANAADCQKKYYSPDWVAQPPKVDVYNYVRAETDLQFKGYSEKYKAFGKFAHSRKPYDVHKQVTQSGNRDTLYSFGVFDLSKSPLTIELPEIGTRYIMFGIRTFADPNSKEDLARAHKLQDAMRVSQSDPGDLSGIPDWNEKNKRVFGLVIDFGTSQSPKSTRPLTTYLCPSRPGHQALRNNFASSLLLRTWLPMTGRRVRRPTLFSLWRKARRENSAASRLLGSTSLRFALHGWQRMMELRKDFNNLGSTLPDSSTFFGVKCDRSYLQNALGVAVG